MTAAAQKTTNIQTGNENTRTEHYINAQVKELIKAKKKKKQ